MTPRKKKDTLSKVEQTALEHSPFQAQYTPVEKIPAIVVEHFPALGRLVAMRFIEWVQQNPEGVVSLPTGKSPEHFIRWVTRVLSEWGTKETNAILEKNGVDPSKKPDLSKLRFVQIDEFYPIDPSQQNSFHHYVKRFYLDEFGLNPENALLIDCSKIGLKKHETLDDIWEPNGHVDLSLRYRHARSKAEGRQKSVLEAVDAWCMDYEEKINDLGGIGFFLGGIGPDGHIGFNISGSDHHTTTRLCPINYETQAAAAADLGGIEVARECLVITIGLQTITRNPDCTALVMAAGEAKAGVVRAAIESEPDILIPGTALHSLPTARFYLTRGASSRLTARRLDSITSRETIDDATVVSLLTDYCDRERKRLLDLKKTEAKNDPFLKAVASGRSESLPDLAKMVHADIEKKIECGMKTRNNQRFLHTEPHHDDVMLGYFAHCVRHFRHTGNTHHFVTLTSGFTSVTNAFMREQVAGLRNFLHTPAFRELHEEGYFDPDNSIGRNRDVWQYLDGVAGRSEDLKAEGCARRLLRCLIEVFEESQLDHVEDRLQELEHYFGTQYPGKRDPEHIQRLKGMSREWEAECLWGYYGWNCDSVMHLRLGFYTGDIFTEEPTRERDVPPIVRVLEKSNPDLVSVALDPEASGPDTHYKVLQAIAEALRIHEKKTGRSDIRLWGYRNVWYRFDPGEANIFVPVSMAGFSVMHDAFMNAFITQKQASFPSYEHEGPFSELAQRIQVEQYQKIKNCLGREWFYEHSSPLIRATRGLVFLREMELEEFYEGARELRQSLENA